MKHCLPFIVLALLTLPIATTAHAQSNAVGFQSPSRNIACLSFPDGNQNAIRCDIAAMESKPRRPANCELEYGQAFMMQSKGGAERICYGDALTDKPQPVLPYGEVWQRGGFTCTSEQAGVTCSNAERHGFSLSRAKQELF